MSKKFRIVREERDSKTGRVYHKAVGSLLLDDDPERGGTLYLNMLTTKYTVVYDGHVQARPDTDDTPKT